MQAFSVLFIGVLCVSAIIFLGGVLFLTGHYILKRLEKYFDRRLADGR